MSILAAIAMMGSGAEATLPAPTVSFVSATTTSITVRVSHPYTTDATAGDLTSSVWVSKDAFTDSFWLTQASWAYNSGTSTTDVTIGIPGSGNDVYVAPATEYSITGRVLYAYAQNPGQPRIIYSPVSAAVLMSTT